MTSRCATLVSVLVAMQRATNDAISDCPCPLPGLFFQVEFSADQRGIYETGVILTLALIVIVSVSCVCACGTRRRELPGTRIVLGVSFGNQFGSPTALCAVAAWLARPVYCTCVVAWLLFIGEALVTTQRCKWHTTL